MIRAVTFDLWHTVLEEPMEGFSDFLKKRRSEEMMKVFEAHGIPRSLEEIERAYDVQGRRLWDIWSRGADTEQRIQIGIVLSELGIGLEDANNALLGDVQRVYNEVLAQSPPVPFDGASDLLGKLKGMGLSLAIISNTGRTDGAFFRELLDGFGLGQFFDTMVFSNEMGIRKPNKEIFLETLRRLGVRPEEAIHVGDDSDADVAGAKGAGMTGVLLLVQGRDPTRGSPDFVVSRLSEVLNVIEQLGGMS